MIQRSRRERKEHSRPPLSGLKLTSNGNEAKYVKRDVFVLLYTVQNLAIQSVAISLRDVKVDAEVSKTANARHATRDLVPLIYAFLPPSVVALISTTDAANGRSLSSGG